MSFKFFMQILSLRTLAACLPELNRFDRVAYREKNNIRNPHYAKEADLLLNETAGSQGCGNHRLVRWD